MKITKRSIETRQMIVAALKESPWSTAGQVADAAGVSESTARKHLKLMEEGEIVVANKKTLGPYVSARVYALAEIEKKSTWAIMIDGVHFYPEDVRLKVVLDGVWAGKRSGRVDYGYQYKDYPILDWNIAVVTKSDIGPLEDGDDHELAYYDQRFRVWIKGRIILIRKEVERAVLEGDKRNITWVYYLNGLGPRPEKMLWYDGPTGSQRPPTGRI